MRQVLVDRVDPLTIEGSNITLHDQAQRVFTALHCPQKIDNVTLDIATRFISLSMQSDLVLERSRNWDMMIATSYTAEVSELRRICQRNAL